MARMTRKQLRVLRRARQLDTAKFHARMRAAKVEIRRRKLTGMPAHNLLLKAAYYDDLLAIYPGSGGRPVLALRGWV